MISGSRFSKSLTLSLFALSFVGVANFSLVAPSEARSKFEKASVDPADQNFKAGIAFMRERNYEAAVDSFQQAIYFSRNRYNPEAYKYLGLCFKATRQYPKAIQAFLQHLSQTQEPAPDARIDLAECYIEIKEFDKAKDEIQASFRDAPSNKGTWRQRYCQGELSERMGDDSQAIAFYQNAVDEKKNYADAWMGRARCYVKTGNYNNAIRDYKIMLDRSVSMPDLNYEELYYAFGSCLFRRGDHQGALDNWRLCLERNPENYDAHVALASMFDQEKHISSAVTEYQAAISAFPKWGEAAAKQKIERRLVYLESQLAPKDAPTEIKPSPSMRKEFDETEKPGKRLPSLDQEPMPKDSGF